MAALALAALLVLVWIGARGSHGNASTPTTPDLDPAIPPDVKATVLHMLASETDPAKLRLLAATLPGYPKAAAALEARAKVLASTLQKNADRINALLSQIHDAAWRNKVQTIVMKTTDLPSLEILRGFFVVGEPAAAEILGLKIAALQGQTAYTPPAANAAAAVVAPGVFNLFASGKYQGCENEPGCNVADAKFGVGPGPMGLDAGLATLSSEAAEALAGMLVFLPATFAKTFKANSDVQKDSYNAFAVTLGSIANGIASRLPMTAKALLYKVIFVSQSGPVSAAHTGGGAGIPVIVGQAAAWLRAQDPAHHSGGWPAFEDPRGGIGPSGEGPWPTTVVPTQTGLLYPFHGHAGLLYPFHRLDAGGKPVLPPPPGPGYAQWARRGLPIGHNVWF